MSYFLILSRLRLSQRMKERGRKELNLSVVFPWKISGFQMVSMDTGLSKCLELLWCPMGLRVRDLN